MTGDVEHWNRRRFERLALHCGCWLLGDAITVYGRTIDIGRGGLFLRTAVRLPRGLNVDVRLQLPGCIDELSAHGTVVWAGNADGRMGVAVEFQQERDQQAFDDFLARRRTSAVA